MQALAPIKINLSLRITGRRPDGYHELDSIVAFLNIGDIIEVRPSSSVSLSLTGKFSASLSTEDNLALRAAKLLQTTAGTTHGAAISLEKNTPIGAGLGGGSADAAAVLRLLNQLWELNYSLEKLANIGLELGADIPACIYCVPLRMQGIGEIITPMPELPVLHGVLIYPDSPCLTADVYRTLSVAPADDGAMDTRLRRYDEEENDLQQAAITLCPAIQDALEALTALPECTLSRMSGSGSTCFGLFESTESAKNNAELLQQRHPAWWVQPFKTITNEDP